MNQQLIRSNREMANDDVRDVINPLKPSPSNCYTLCHTGLTYQFSISDIRALWRSALSARVPECQKLKTDRSGLYGVEYSTCYRTMTLGFKGLISHRRHRCLRQCVVTSSTLVSVYLRPEILETLTTLPDCISSTSAVTNTGDVQAPRKASSPCAHSFTLEQVVCICEVLMASAQVVFSLVFHR